MVEVELVLNAVNDNAYPGNLIYKVRKIIIPTEVPVNFVLTILPAYINNGLSGFEKSILPMYENAMSDGLTIFLFVIF